MYVKEAIALARQYFAIGSLTPEFVVKDKFLRGRAGAALRPPPLHPRPRIAL